MATWLVIMTNGDEYLINSETTDAKEFLKQIFHPNNQNTISVWFTKRTKKGYNSVCINSSAVSSVEFEGVDRDENI